MKQAAGSLGGSARAGDAADAPARNDRTRQGQEHPRFVHRLGEPGQIAVEADQIEEIAIFTGRGIGLMCSST